MRVIARKSLIEFCRSLEGQKDHDAVKSALDNWFYAVSRASWQTSAEVRRQFTTVSIISADRLVFNVKGNSYRLVVAVNYRLQIIWIKWIGSHHDYDQIDAQKVEYGQGPN